MGNNNFINHKNASRLGTGLGAVQTLGWFLTLKEPGGLTDRDTRLELVEDQN